MTALPQGPVLLTDHPALLAGITAAFNTCVAEGPFAILDRAGPSPESVAFWFGPDGAPIAFATLVDAGGNTAWLDLLYVRPEHRRKGLGIALVRECMASARSKGAIRLCTGVSYGNRESTALMTALGMHRRALVFGQDLT